MSPDRHLQAGDFTSRVSEPGEPGESPPAVYVHEHTEEATPSSVSEAGRAGCWSVLVFTVTPENDLS